MCCCVPLKKLVVGGAIIHILIGITYLIYLVPLIFFVVDGYQYEGQLAIAKGLLFGTYFVLFLPLGCFILYGTMKKLRPWVKWPSLIFLLLQLYVTLIQIQFGLFVNLTFGSERILKEVRKTDIPEFIIIQASFAFSYLFTLFFFCREIDDRDNPVQMNQNKYSNVIFYQPQVHHPVQLQQQFIPPQHIHNIPISNRPINNMNHLNLNY